MILLTINDTRILQKNCCANATRSQLRQFMLFTAKRKRPELTISHNTSFSIWPKKINCMFLLTRPTLFYAADPKLFSAPKNPFYTS